MASFESLSTVSYSLSNCGSILHHFGDKARYWSKIAIFSYHLHSTPLLTASPSEYRDKVCFAKTRMVKLSDGEKVWGYGYSLHRIHDCDRRTERQTPHDVIGRAYAYHRAVKKGGGIVTGWLFWGNISREMSGSHFKRQMNQQILNLTNGASSWHSNI